MAKPQPPPASSKKPINPTTTTTTGTRSSISKNSASSNQNSNTATNSTRLGPRTASANQQQNLQEQKGHYYTKPQQTLRQRSPQRLSTYNGKDSIQYKKDADAGERVLKKRRVSKPYRSQENTDDSESQMDEPQERVRPGSLGAAMGVQGRARRALASFEATEAQDDEETDTDDFQARFMVRSRRHEYGQGRSNNINSSNNNTTTISSINRDLSSTPPYPEHLSSTLPDRSLRSLALTRGTTISSSPQTYSATSAPSHKRPPSKAPSSVSDAPRVLDLRMTLKKPKVEEQDGENGPLRPSHSLPTRGSPHEADVYKAMEDHGMDLWKEWCKSMHYDDKDQVTPIKLKDYIDFEVMPKDREMMRKSWRLPGHPGFIAVSGLEAYIRPVVRLWCEQSLQAELEALRDAKLKAARLQQQQQQSQQKLDHQLQQPLQPPPSKLQPRQVKPKSRLRQSLQPLPLKDVFVSSNRQPAKVANTTTTKTNRVEGRKEGRENVKHEETEEHYSGRTDEQEEEDETKDADQDTTNNNHNNIDGISGYHTTSNITKSDDRDLIAKLDDRDAVRDSTGRDYRQDKPATGGVSIATTKSKRLAASSASTLPSTSSPSAAALTPNKSPPRPPSSHASAHGSQIRAKDIQLLKLLDLASPKVDHVSGDRAMKHRLNPRVKTIANVLTEWTVGIEGGPSIQKMNSDYGLIWQYSDEEKEYCDREAIVREFKRLVVEDGKSDEDAQALLEGELASSSKACLVERLRNFRKVSFSSLTAS